MSVVLPVCNGERYVGAAIDSALEQTHTNLELIVVDDGSSDRTRAVVDDRAARDARVRVVSQANGGVAAARNRALADARGEFVAPLDADDVWDPTKVARQVARMREAGDSTGLVYSWWVSFDAGGALLDASPRWQVEGDGIDLLIQVNYTGNASVPLYRRRTLEDVGGYDPTLRARGAEGCEDWDVALKVAERSQVAVVPAALAGYRRHSGSMSTRSRRMWRSHELVMAGVRQRRPGISAGLTQDSRRQFALHLAGVAYWGGAYQDAIGWGLRAVRSTVAFRILPHVVTLFPRKRHPGSDRIVPGAPFGSWPLPPPLIPYDRIYQSHAAAQRARAAARRARPAEQRV